MTPADRSFAGGPSGAVPHFSAQRPDHSPPELLDDDELAHAIDSLRRKLASARRMLAIANFARFTLLLAMLVGGFAILWAGPAPFLELIEGRRVLGTVWDVLGWWFLVLALFVVIGGFATEVSRRRRRRAAGWQHRVEELERRLDDAQRTRDVRLGR